MNSFAAEDASLAALEARATAAEQRLAALEAVAAGGISGSSQPAPGGGAQTAAAGAAMIASPMAVYTAELQGIRAVLVQAKDVQLELETKLKEAAVVNEKQAYRIQHLITSFKESEAKREEAEKEAAALKTSTA